MNEQDFKAELAEMKGGMSTVISRSVALVLIATMLAAGIANAVQAEEEKPVAVPLIYPHSQEGVNATSACLQIKEKVYSPERAPWESFKDTAQEVPEHALVETITAMQQKDVSRLKELSHPGRYSIH